MKNEIAKSLPSDLQVAMKAPKIREGIDRSRYVEIYRRALTLAGHRNFDSELVSAEITLLIETLERDYAGITIDELFYISQRGAVGEYGENMGISVATFVKWVKGYLGSHERKEALKRAKTKPKQIEKRKDLTQEEKIDLWNGAEDRVKNGLEVQGAILLYKIGVELGYIDQTDDLFVEEVRYYTQKWFKEKMAIIQEQGQLSKKMLLKHYQSILKAGPEERRKSKLWASQAKRVAIERVIINNNQDNKN